MVRIVIDSGSDYVPEDAQARGIEVIPLVANIDGTEYRDSIDLGRDEFYELLDRTGAFPTTSQIPPYVFADTFKKAREAGDEVVALILSSALSGTYQNALLAKAMAGNEGIYIVDSRTATYAIQILVDHAADLRDKGASAAEIADALEDLKGSVKILAALDTLEYLQRGGRLTKTVAKIGGAANFKPIITVTEEGEVVLVNACLGRKKALDAVMKLFSKYEVDERFPLYSIYSYGVKNCEKLEQRLADADAMAFQRKQIGFVIGAHIGPDACGIVFVERKDKQNKSSRFFFRR